MQNLEIAAVVVLFGAAAFLLRRRLRTLDDAPLGVRLGVGFSLGGLIALFVLVRGLDILPDDLEVVAQPILFALVIAALVVVAISELR